MKRFRLLVLALVATLGAAAVTTLPATSQTTPPGGGGKCDGSGGYRHQNGRGALGAVLRMDAVRRHLRLNDRQCDALDQFLRRGPGAGDGVRQGGDPARNRTRNGDPLAAILGEGAYQRAHQLGFQYGGCGLWLDPSVGGPLRLTDQQRTRIRAIVDAHGLGDGGPRGDATAWAVRQEAKRQAFGEAWGLLDQNQRRTWTRLAGPKFDGWEPPRGLYGDGTCDGSGPRRP